MKALIDFDLIAYEVGFASQKNINGELVPLPMEDVISMVDNKIKDICAAVYATEPPLLFLTGKGNFRNDIAKQQPYKGKRKNAKPFHHAFIRAYAMASYDFVLTEGIEADDALCIMQMKRLAERDTIICSRDKDLRMCEGFHYGWEAGKQGSWGPKWVDKLGELELKGPKKLIGTGTRFFYAQVLMGDSTDCYDGLGGCGPIGAHRILEQCTTEVELFKAVLDAYRSKYGGIEGYERMKEMCQLAWMVREEDGAGKPVMYKMLEVE